jgi:glucosylceramidase
MILALDHNFENHIEADSIMAATLNTVQGIAYHWYEGEPEEMLSTVEYFKNKLVYVTEAATSRKGAGSKLVEDSAKIVRELRSGSSAHISWNIALGQDGGPTYNDVNLHNTGLLSCDLNKKEISYDVDYYILAHFSKFIHKGAVVLNSTDTGIDTDYKLVNVVTVNPNGSMTAVLVNYNKSEAQTCKLVLGDKVMEVTLEAKSLVTLTWDGNIQNEK